MGLPYNYVRRIDSYRVSDERFDAARDVAINGRYVVENVQSSSGPMADGWDTKTLPAGTTLHRISHPAVPDGSGVYSQAYSTATITTTSSTCMGTPRPSFIYSIKRTGGIGGGSSGSATIIDGGYIVGQLFGGCALAGQPDGCSALTYAVDGSLRASYAVLQPFIDPQPTTGCTANATATCLLNSRFRVTVNYRNQFTNPPSPGDFIAARLNPNATTPDVGIFGLGTAHAVEVVVRIADARPFEPRFHIYYSGLTDLGYWVNVTDTATGTTRTYHNPAGKIGGGVDRSSFAEN